MVGGLWIAEVENLKKKLLKDSDVHRQDNTRVLQENVQLIIEINNLSLVAVGMFVGVDSNHSFQPSFSSKTDRRFPDRDSGGFLERDFC